MAKFGYNGFTRNERQKGSAVARKKYASGEWTRPTQCSACGVTTEEGARVEDHDEDYDHQERRFPLCLQCHRALHARFKTPNTFESYRKKIKVRVGKPTILNLLELEEIDYATQIRANTNQPPHPDDLI